MPSAREALYSLVPPDQSVFCAEVSRLVGVGATEANIADRCPNLIQTPFILEAARLANAVPTEFVMCKLNRLVKRLKENDSRGYMVTTALFALDEQAEFGDSREGFERRQDAVLSLSGHASWETFRRRHLHRYVAHVTENIFG